MQSNVQRNATNVTNTQLPDSTSKIIFDEPVLCAQFLRDYTNIPMLKDVQPEDIEDVSERFVHLFSEERNADTVKRVNLKNQVPFFLVSLIEHKTYVDYNVSMQILRYMVYIWEDYEKEMNRLHESDKTVKIKSQKEFKYPVILPIVYYEGKQEWTAPLELKERIWLQEEFARYIPNFAYELIQLNHYTNETLLSHKDEISLIMMFNKLQNISDVDEIREIRLEEIESIVRNTPEYLLEVVAKVIRAFLFKMNLPVEETEEVVGKVKERKMGYLFENMEKMDIQLERRLRREAEEKANKAEEKANKAEEKANKAEEKANKAEEKANKAEEKANKAEERLKEIEEKYVKNKIRAFIEVCQELGVTKEDARRMVLDRFGTSGLEIDAYFANWS